MNGQSSKDTTMGIGTKLSKYFTLEELIHSDNAIRLNIDNSPTDEELKHALEFLVPGLESVRNFLGTPIKVNSAFRSKTLNAATPGSSNTSQHTLFEACDFISPEYGTPLEISKALVASNVKFDQLIYEYGAWVHVSFGPRNRRQVLSKHHGIEGYPQGIVLPNGRRVL